MDFNEDKTKITEARLQSACFLWFHENFKHLRGLLYHVPNGGQRDPREGAKFKAMGVVAGVPDLCFHYRQRTYFFEFKNVSGKGKLSTSQEKVIAALEIQNFEVWLVTSVDYFQGLIIEILERKDFEVEKLLDKESFFYNTKVFTYLYSLEARSVIEIASVCEEANAPKFISCITDFINQSLGQPEGFELLFTPDYKAFYKKEFNDSREIIYNSKSTI